MITKAEEKVKETEKSPAPLPDDSKPKTAVEGEFNVSVRKLKVPVRPRGVLAE